jgi:hypothetical protein
MRLTVLGLLAALVLPPSAHAEFVATEDDFRCLLDGHRVEGKNFVVFHAKPRRLKRAIRVAERDLPRRYPVGTILQLFPFEAMVKRGGRFNRAGNGWEFFRLAVGPEGTTILARGGEEVANGAGSCQTCHAAAKKFDFVCEGHDVTPLNLPPRAIEILQEDPRCPAVTPAATP